MRGSEELQVEGKGAWALTQEDAQHDTRLVRCLDPPPRGKPIQRQGQDGSATQIYRAPGRPLPQGPSWPPRV